MTRRPLNRMNTTIAAASRGVTDRTTSSYLGSNKMYSMHEALARDRMREHEQRSRQARLARELAAERRWHRVSMHARAAQARHARRVSRAAVR
jgi:hypothetical protein